MVKTPPGLPGDPPRRQRLRASSDRIVAATTVVNFALGAVWVVVFVALVATGLSHGADYTAFYTGWRMVIEGQGSQLYDPAAQAAMQVRVLGGQSFEAADPLTTRPTPCCHSFRSAGSSRAEFPRVVRNSAWAPCGRSRLAARRSRPNMVALGAAGLDWVDAGLAIARDHLLARRLLLVARHGCRRDLSRNPGWSRGGWRPVARGRVDQAPGDGRCRRCSARRPAMGRRGCCGLASGAFGLLATLVLGTGIWLSYFDFLGRYASTFDQLSVRPAVMWNVRGTLTLLLGRDARVVHQRCFDGCLRRWACWPSRSCGAVVGAVRHPSICRQDSG